MENVEVFEVSSFALKRGYKVARSPKGFRVIAVIRVFFGYFGPHNAVSIYINRTEVVRVLSRHKGDILVFNAIKKFPKRVRSAAMGLVPWAHNVLL